MGDVSVTKLESAIELIDESAREIALPDGRTLSLEIGTALVHAVRTDAMQVGEPIDPGEAICGTAHRDLTPTFWAWESDHPEHLMRCPACLKLAPLSSLAQ